MTITIETTSESHQGNGVTTSWSVAISISEEDTVVVEYENTSGVFSTLVLNTDFTVTNILAAAFTLTLTSFTLQTGEYIHIRSEEDYTQAVPLPEGGTYPSATLEAMYDKLTRLAQQLKTLVSSCFRFDLTRIVGVSLEMDEEVTPGSYFRVNSAGDGIEQTDGIPDSVDYTANVEAAETVTNADNVEVATTVTNGTTVANASVVTNADVAEVVGRVEQATQVVDTTTVIAADTVNSAGSVGSSVNTTVYEYTGQFMGNANGNPNISDTYLVLSTAIAVDTWTTIGPTGSGADVIWTALDSLVAGMSFIELSVKTYCSSATLFSLIINATESGSSEVIGDNNIVYYEQAIQSVTNYEVARQVPGIKVPIDQYGICKLARLGEPTTNSIVLYLISAGKSA